MERWREATDLPLLIEGFTLQSYDGAAVAQRATNGKISEGRGNAKWFDLFVRTFNTSSCNALVTAKFGNTDVLKDFLAANLRQFLPVCLAQYWPIDIQPAQTWNVALARAGYGTDAGTVLLHLHVYYQNIFDTPEFRSRSLNDSLHLVRQDFGFAIGAGNIFRSQEFTLPDQYGDVCAMMVTINADYTDLTDTAISIQVNNTAVMVNVCAALFANAGLNTIVNRSGLKMPVFIQRQSTFKVEIEQLSGARSVGAIVQVGFYFDGCK